MPMTTNASPTDRSYRPIRFRGLIGTSPRRSARRAARRFAPHPWAHGGTGNRAGGSTARTPRARIQATVRFRQPANPRSLPVLLIEPARRGAGRARRVAGSSPALPWFRGSPRPATRSPLPPSWRLHTPGSSPAGRGSVPAPAACGGARWKGPGRFRRGSQWKRWSSAFSPCARNSKMLVSCGCGPLNNAEACRWQ